MTTEQKADILYNLSDSEKSLEMWVWFEDNIHNYRIYPGDATPDDYLDVMSDEEIEKCYNDVMEVT